MRNSNDAYELQVGTGALDEAIKKTRELANASEQTQKAVEKLNRAITGGGSGGGSASSSGSAGPRQMQARPYKPIGPFGSGSYAQERLENLRAAGYREDSDAVRNARYAALRAQDRERRAGERLEDGPGNLAQDVFNRTRFHLPLGINPLGRDLKNFADPEYMGKFFQSAGLSKNLAGTLGEAAASVGSVVAALGPALTAGYAVYRAFDSTAQFGGRIGASQYLGGGSSGQASAANMLSGGDPSASMRLSNALQQGGYGAAIAAANGIVDYGPMQVDKTTNYLKMARMIRSLPNDQAILAARSLGLSPEEFGQMRNTSPGNFEQLMNQRSMEGAAGAGADWEAQKSTLANNFHSALLPIIKGANYLMEAFSAIGDPEYGKGQKVNDSSSGSWMADSGGYRVARAERIGGGARSAGQDLSPGEKYNVLTGHMDGQMMVTGAYSL